jgi:hypothetical protein
LASVIYYVSGNSEHYVLKFKDDKSGEYFDQNGCQNDGYATGSSKGFPYYFKKNWKMHIASILNYVLLNRSEVVDNRKRKRKPNSLFTQ